MAEPQLTVASAVVVPEAPESSSPQNILKRRRSSVSENGSKRPRLSIDGNHEPDRDPAPPSAAADRRADRRKSGQAEERKRGQRLFGALLGTLSQSSTTAAQKRRVDIEKKQQAKLKLQAEEFDQKQKERLEELMRVRRREQRKFDEQSMRIRHSNLLAMAHFLQTKTEPRLYYKPWDLRPEDEAQIEAQIEEAEATVDAELGEFERQREDERRANDTNEDSMQVDAEPARPSASVVSEPPNSAQQAGDTADEDIDQTTIDSKNEPTEDGEGDTLMTESVPGATDGTKDDQPDDAAHILDLENGKEAADENGEVVLEGEEDTLIY